MPLLISQYAQNKKLNEACSQVDDVRKRVEEECMYNGQDPSDYQFKALKLQWEEVLETKNRENELMPKSIPRRVLSRIPYKKARSENDESEIAGALLKRLKTSYEATSSIRKSYANITFLAYMTEPPVETGAYRNVTNVKWHVKFDLLQTPDPQTWNVLGYIESDFQTWWKIRQNVAPLKDKVGQEWKDMKALYGGLVILLASMAFSDLRETPLKKDFVDLTHQLKVIGNDIYQAITHPEYYDRLCELFGYFAPIVFVCLKRLEAIKEAFDKERKADVGNVQLTADFYRRQVTCLKLLTATLMEKTEAHVRFIRDAAYRNRNVPAPEKTPSRLDENRSEETAKLSTILESLTIYDAKGLTDLGLKEIRLSGRRGRQIGFGSYAMVCERCVPGTIRCYAVKEPILVSSVNRDELWNRIGREAEIWTSLAHENILPLRGFYLLPGNIPALVMDTCKWNLREFVEFFHPVQESHKLRLLHGVIKAIQYLHSLNIAHGDLRASNILVQEDGAEAMLSDFNVAYYVEEGSHQTLPRGIFETTHGQVGNPRWLSPELLQQVSSREAEGDLASYRPCVSLAGDIYSFGCVFLEAYYERDPYQSFDSIEEMKTSKLRGILPATADEIGNDFYSFLGSLWNPDPAKRPSAETVLDGMQSFVHD